MIVSPYLAMLFVQGWLDDLFHEDCRRKSGGEKIQLSQIRDSYPHKPEMRSSLKKEISCWGKYYGVRRCKLNAEITSDGIEIKMLAATDWHSHPITTGFIALLHGLVQSKWIKVARWFTAKVGFPLILKVLGQQVYHGTSHHLKVP